MIQKAFLKLEKIESYLKRKLFYERIDYKLLRYKRKNERDMESDEIEEYKFKLFIIYSLVACVPLVIFIIMIMGG